MRCIRKVLLITILLISVMMFKSNVKAFEYFHEVRDTDLFHYDITGSLEDDGETLDLKIDFYGTKNDDISLNSPRILVLYDLSTTMSELEIIKYKAQLIRYIYYLEDQGYDYVVMPISALYEGYGPEYNIYIDPLEDPGSFNEETFFYNRNASFWVSILKNLQPSSNYYPPVEFDYEKVIYITTQPSNYKEIKSGEIPNNQSTYHDCSVTYQDWGNEAYTDYYNIQYNYKNSNDYCKDVIYTDDTNLYDELIKTIYTTNKPTDYENNLVPLELRINANYGNLNTDYRLDSMNGTVTVLKNGEVIDAPLYYDNYDYYYTIAFHTVSTYDPVSEEFHVSGVDGFEFNQNYTINIKLKLDDNLVNNPNVNEYNLNFDMSEFIPRYIRQQNYSYWSGYYYTYIDYIDNFNLNNTIREKFYVYYDLAIWPGFDYDNAPQEVKEDFGIENFDIVEEYSIGDIVHLDDINDPWGNFQGWLLPTDLEEEFSFSNDESPLGDTSTYYDDIEKLDDYNFIMPAHNVYVVGVWKYEDLYKTVADDVEEYFKPEGTNNSLSELDTEADKINILFGDFCWEVISTDENGAKKVIYNGEPDAEGMCGTDRGNHGGISDSDIINLTDEYYYGTSYNYDYERKKYTLTGTLVQETWSDLTANNLIGKYTCKSNNSLESCNTLYYIDSYSSESDANVFVYDQNINYASIGKSAFNTGATNSLSGLGYMYGDPYYYEETVILTTQEVVYSVPIDTSYYIAETYDYSNDEYKFQVSDNPVQISSLSSLEDIEGKYTFFSDNSSYSDDEMYYIVGVDDNNIYYLPLYDGDTITDIEEIYYYSPDGYYDAGENVFVLEDTQGLGIESVSNLDWFYTMDDTEFLYICKGGTTCSEPYEAEQITSTSFKYYTNYLFGDEVTYDPVTGKYTLVFTEYDSNYTCLSQDDTCEEVYYFIDYNPEEYKIIYISLSNGDTIETARQEMLIDLKYDSEIKKVVEEWYRNNLLKYQNYLVDGPFINDYFDGEFYINYTSTKDLSTDEPVLDPYEDITIGNGKLAYPIGIFELGPTDKEISYWIGNAAFYHNGNYILIYNPEHDYENNWLTVAEGATEKHDIRPVIILSPKLKVVGGQGTTTAPYIVSDGSTAELLAKAYIYSNFYGN